MKELDTNTLRMVLLAALTTVSLASSAQITEVAQHPESLRSLLSLA